MKMRIYNYKEIKRILSHDSVFWTSIDDSIESKDSLTEAVVKAGIWLKPFDNTLFFFKKVNAITYEVHVAIIDGEARKHSQESTIKCGNWMFKNTDCQKIMGFIPAEYKHMVMLMIMCGGRREGILTSSWKIDNKVSDMILVGITKDEFYQINEV